MWHDKTCLKIGGFDTEAPVKPCQIIHLTKRNFSMLKQDLIDKNPLSMLSPEDILVEGGLGAVIARAGVGKTAFLVQLALNSLLQNMNVLHISLNDPVRKVCLWYEEVVRNIAEQYEIRKTDLLWEAILPHRFVMTFNIDGFSVPKLEERLNDLAEQDIFLPKMVIVDGLPIDTDTGEALDAFKTLAKTYSIHAWFAMKIHRHESTDTTGMPVSFANVSDRFNTIFRLQPQGEKINVEIIKGKTQISKEIFLDPSTMLIKD